LLGANAEGETSIPLFIFKGKRLSSKLIRDDSSYLMGVQKSGWMDQDIFLKFLKRFEESIREKRGKRKNEEGEDELEPVLILADQHSSRFTLESASFAEEHGIDIILSPASSSHLLQPLDVSGFGPLKTFFGEAKMSHVHGKHKQGLAVEDVVPLTQKALSKVTAEVFKKGFQKVGIWPTNIHALDTELQADGRETKKKDKDKRKRKRGKSTYSEELRALRQEVRELQKDKVNLELQAQVLTERVTALEEERGREKRRGVLPKDADGLLLTGKEAIARQKEKKEKDAKEVKAKEERKVAKHLKREQKEQKNEEKKGLKEEKARAREARKAEDAQKKEAARLLRELQREEKKRKMEEQKGQGRQKRQKKGEREDHEQEQEQEQDHEQEQEQEHQEDLESPCKGRGGIVREALEFFNALLNTSAPSSPSSSSPSSPSSTSSLDDDLGSSPPLSPLELPSPEPPGDFWDVSPWKETMEESPAPFSAPSMKAARTVGDGDCFYRAVSLSLWGSQDHSAYLKEAAARHLKENEEKTNLFLARQGEGKTLEWLSANLRRRGEWASEYESAAVADFLQREIFIFGHQRSKRDLPVALRGKAGMSHRLHRPFDPAPALGPPVVLAHVPYTGRGEANHFEPLFLMDPTLSWTQFRPSFSWFQ
jgi:hypothetical protein